MTFYFPSRTEDLTLNVRDPSPRLSIQVSSVYCSIIGLPFYYTPLPMVLVLFANTNFKMYLLRVLSLIQELRFNVSVSVSMSGSGAMDLGVGKVATSWEYTCLSRHFFLVCV